MCLDDRNQRSGMGILFMGISFPVMRYIGNPIEVLGSCENVKRQKGEGPIQVFGLTIRS